MRVGCRASQRMPTLPTSQATGRALAAPLDEWHQDKHDVPARRTWRKLHLAIDEHHQVLACELTPPEVGDTTAVPDLLDQITTPFATFMGDGVGADEELTQLPRFH